MATSSIERFLESTSCSAKGPITRLCCAQPCLGQIKRIAAVSRRVGEARYLAEIVDGSRVAIAASGQRAEILRRARAVAPDGGVKDPGRIRRVSRKGSALVNAEARALNSSKRLEEVHASGWAPVEAE